MRAKSSIPVRGRQLALAFVVAFLPGILYSQQAASQESFGVQADFKTADGAIFALRNISLTPTSRIPIFRATVTAPANGATDGVYVDVAAEIVCADGTHTTLKFSAGLGNLKPGDNSTADPIVTARGAFDSDCHLVGLTSISFKSGKHIEMSTIDDRERLSSSIDEKYATCRAEMEAEAAARKKREREEKAACAEVYKGTSNKKISDLTVIEDRAVKGCEALGYYHQ